jgi:hypothetical protein
VEVKWSKSNALPADRLKPSRMCEKSDGVRDKQDKINIRTGPGIVPRMRTDERNGTNVDASVSPFGNGAENFANVLGIIDH